MVVGDQNWNQSSSQFHRRLSPSLDSQVLEQPGWHLWLYICSLLNLPFFTCMLPEVSLLKGPPGGTNSACQWLLAHGGLTSSRRQGCGFTKQCPIPLLQAIPKEDALACQLFLWVFVLEQWPWAPGHSDSALILWPATFTTNPTSRARGLEHLSCGPGSLQ